MHKNIFIKFLRDKLGFSVAFFANCLFLMLFYQISTQSNIEIVYPVVISVFVYAILMIAEYIKYYGFNKRLSKSAENINFDLEPSTSEQKEIAQAINKLHSIYTKKIHTLQNETQQKNNFITQWIHNMKTPVSVIDLILQRVSSGEIDQEIAAESIKEENQKLLNNLEQVLSIQRLQDFSRDYIPEPVNLSDAVKRAINNKKNQFIYNNVFPKFDNSSIFISNTSHQNTSVLTDSKWNDIMLDQLISNAIKYSVSENCVKNVYFSIARKGKQTILTIKDEGIGIPKYDLSKIFEPFFTGENGRNYKNASGIGLYICACIAEKLGHKISITSEVGKGTEVTVTYNLPAAQSFSPS